LFLESRRSSTTNEELLSCSNPPGKIRNAKHQPIPRVFKAKLWTSGDAKSSHRKIMTKALSAKPSSDLGNFLRILWIRKSRAETLASTTALLPKAAVFAIEG
jgi:hypothetical protein